MSRCASLLRWRAVRSAPWLAGAGVGNRPSAGVGSRPLAWAPSRAAANRCCRHHSRHHRFVLPSAVTSPLWPPPASCSLSPAFAATAADAAAAAAVAAATTTTTAASDGGSNHAPRSRPPRWRRGVSATCGGRRAAAGDAGERTTVRTRHAPPTCRSPARCAAQRRTGWGGAAEGWGRTSGV